MRPFGARVGFWAGEVNRYCAATDPNFCPRDTGIYTPALWRALRATHATLYLDTVYQADFGPTPTGEHRRLDLIPLIRSAHRYRVPVYAWVTLPVAKGTYADEQNAGTVHKAVVALSRWKHRHHLPIARIVLDLEQATGDEPVADALAGNLGPLRQTMHANIDPPAQCRSMRTYRNTISWAHRHGMPLDGTPVPFSLDDVVDDHNMGMANALDMPAYAPGMYDKVYLQAYQAEFGFQFGSGYVARYYRLMHRYFGAAGQVSLGNTGDPPYTTVGPLVRDVRMLAGMGATAIPIFDLNAAVTSYGITGVKQVVAAGRRPLTGHQLSTAEADLSAQGSGALRLFSTLNTAANTATLAVTASEGKPRQPNSWPNGCGPMTPAPLHHATR